jgi:hypothetical protein
MFLRQWLIEFSSFLKNGVPCLHWPDVGIHHEAGPDELPIMPPKRELKILGSIP